MNEQQKPNLPYGDILSRSFETFGKLFPKLAALFAIPLAINLTGQIAAQILIHKTHLLSGNEFNVEQARRLFEQTSPRLFAAIGAAIVIIAIISWIITIWAEISTMKLVAGADSNKPVGELYSTNWSLVLGLLWVQLLIGLVIAGGLLLLIVPGIIWAIWYSMSMATYVVEGRRGWQAAAASKNYVKGRSGQVFLAGLFFVGIAFGVQFAVGTIGLFSPLAESLADSIANALFLTPLGVIYVYYIYSALKSPSPAASDARN